MSQASNSALIQQLGKHFKLSVDLFSPESAFFFGGAQRQHNLETLRHLSSFGDMALFLTGDKGAGKTTLLKTLETANFEGLNVLYLDAEKIVNQSSGRAANIFFECAKAIGFTPKDGASATELLSDLLQESHRLLALNGLRTLFAFDNADKLPKKDIQVLFNFCKSLQAESALVMLFAGTSILLQWSRSGSQVDQDAWCHQIQLKPFSQADVRDYLEQALMAAKSEEPLDLSESQLQQLSELGKGLPGRINKLFPSVVLEPGLLKIQPKTKRRGFPVQVLFGLAGLLVVSFLFVSYQHGVLDRLMPVFSLEEDSKDQVELTIAVEDKQKAAVIEENQQQQKRLAMLDNVLKEKGLSITQAVNPVESPEQQSSNKSVVSSDSMQASQADDLSEKNLKLNDVAPILLGQEAQLKDEPNAKLSGIEPVTKTEQSQSIEAPVRHENFKSKAWLVSQPQSSYMAQILASYQEQTAQNFVKKVGKQKFEVFYLETEHKGKPWFVVFYGVFPAKTHAQDAVKNAPKLIRKQNPWIRQVSSVLSSYPKS